MKSFSQKLHKSLRKIFQMGLLAFALSSCLAIPATATDVATADTATADTATADTATADTTATNAATNTPSNPSTWLVAEQQQLMIEQTRNNLLARKLQVLQHKRQTFDPSAVTSSLLRQVRLTIDIAQANLESLTLNLNAAHQAVAFSRSHSNSREQQILLDLRQERVQILQRSCELSQQTLTLLREWNLQLQIAYHHQEKVRKQKKLKDLARNLQEEQQQWLLVLSKMNQTLQAREKDTRSPVDYTTTEFYIFQTEERSRLIQNQLDIAKLRNSLDDWALLFKQDMPLGKVNDAERQINLLVNHLRNMHRALNNRIDLIHAHTELINDVIKQGTLQGVAIPLHNNQVMLNLLKTLRGQYQDQIRSVKALEQQANEYQQIANQQLKKQLASRQELPGLSLQEWYLLGKKISLLPLLVLDNLKNLGKSIAIATSHATLWVWLAGLAALLIWLTAWIQLRSYLSKDTSQLEERGQGLFFAQTILIVLQLLKRHLTDLMLLVGLFGFQLLFRISIKISGLVVSVAVVTVTLKLVLTLAHILLLENVSDGDAHNTKLYYRLRKVLLVGGLTTVLTFISHQLPINYEVQDFFGRLFMIFLLLVSGVLMRAWQVLPNLLELHFNKARTYLKRVIRWLSFLIPFSLFCNALLGLIGYIELSWAIAAYQGLFLIVFTGYLIIRGLLDELVHWLSERSIRQLRNGWLWSEAFLKPLHQVLKLALLLLTLTFLFDLYGWDQHSFVVNTIGKLLSLRLFTVSNTPFNLSNLIMLIITVAILRWAALWSREFSYRWLFAGTKDLSLRNSLSIFTQYTTVAVGTALALNAVGLSLTTLTWIISAFSLGIGFGLRDLANNFASGILLLIERPIKLGDWVSAGDTEGRITHIGARSVTVTASDNQELFIPNAEIFSKTFVNWTYQNNIVRVLLPIRVNRVDDPHAVKKIILEVMKKIPSILSEPKQSVYFEDIDESLLDFQVEYYVDMKNISSRLQVRSSFLFALWDRFKAEGIRSPDDVVQKLSIQGTLTSLPATPSSV